VQLVAPYGRGLADIEAWPVGIVSCWAMAVGCMLLYPTALPPRRSALGAIARLFLESVGRALRIRPVQPMGVEYGRSRGLVPTRRRIG